MMIFYKEDGTLNRNSILKAVSISLNQLVRANGLIRTEQKLKLYIFRKN